VVGVYKRVYGQAAKLAMVHDLDEARALIAQKREEATRKTQEHLAVQDDDGESPDQGG
jgi:hypothetical protein